MATPALTRIQRLSEMDFWELYFRLENATKEKIYTLYKQEIKLASIICTKPSGYSLLTGVYSGGESEKYKLADDLRVYYPNFKTNAIYGVLSSLKGKGIIVETEDRLNLVLHPALQGIQRVVKSQLTKGEFQMDYTLHLTIHGPQSNQKSTGTASARRLEPV